MSGKEALLGTDDECDDGRRQVAIFWVSSPVRE